MFNWKSTKAVLFDADGTLYNSMPLHFEAGRKVCRELYDFDLTEKLFFDECVDRYKKTTEVLKEHGMPCNDKDFRAKKESHYVEIAKQKLKLTPGLTEFLEKLKKENIKCVIVSGATKNSIEDSLKILNIGHYFDFHIAHEDTLTQPKPAPYPYRLALQKLKLSPKDCIAFEDTQGGIASAKGAGLNCIGILNTGSDKNTLAEADMVIADFSELNYF